MSSPCAAGPDTDTQHSTIQQSPTSGTHPRWFLGASRSVGSMLRSLWPSLSPLGAAGEGKAGAQGHAAPQHSWPGEGTRLLLGARSSKVFSALAGGGECLAGCHPLHHECPAGLPHLLADIQHYGGEPLCGEVLPMHQHHLRGALRHQCGEQ